MAGDSKKPKVGVYGDETVTKMGTTTTTTEPTTEEESGGIPSWMIGLIILAVVIIALVLIF